MHHRILSFKTINKQPYICMCVFDIICKSVIISSTYIIYHISYIIYHISYIIYHISYIIYHISYIIYHISYIIYHISYIIYHISYIIYHISYIIYHISYIIYHIWTCFLILTTFGNFRYEQNSKSIFQSKFCTHIFHRALCEHKNRYKTSRLEIFTFWSHL